ncbi:uncharacterized protein YtfN [Photobacterium aphoticum]|uniref:Uncharacterized protein YtfN n=1 Tax=Photobacterium aphoticum TaxID=754436 RepID=A0A090RHB8_9GAMM|nr:uncharacterized protein YtfN [Photobacterium aphoticum]
MTGFSLHDVRYHDDLVDLDAQNVALVIDDHCLLTPAVCVSQLALDGVRFSMPTLPPTTEPEPTDSEPMTTIEMPLPIRVDSVALNDIQLDILGNKVAWKAFTTAATMEGDTLTLKPTVWDTITLALAPTDPAETTTAKKAEAEKAPAEPITLPEVVLPLVVDVERLTVKDFALQGDTPQSVKLLDLVASARDSDVNVKSLVLDVPQGHLEAKADVTLTGDYPLSLDAKADIALEPLQGHHLALNASGSVADLALNATLRGTLDAALSGKLAPLDPQLPFDLNLKSQHLQWPIATAADFTLDKTRLTAKGDLSAFRFDLKSQIDGKPMPAVGASLTGKGSLSHVELSKLALDTLGGKITGNARASWKDLVNWKGELAFEHIQPGLEWKDVQGI